ncbi:MAG: RNA polymerase sigma factor [Mangrovibacterium sp.]
MMKSYTNEELFQGILKHDNLVLQYIYKNFFYKISLFIKKNNGDDEDSNDIFQEAIIIIYRKLKDNDLDLDCSFETYLYSVCRYMWLKQLEKQKTKKKIQDSFDFNEDIYDQAFEATVDMNEKYRLYQKHFQNLGKDCQKILQMSFDRTPMKQIVQVMGYQNENYARKRKQKCKEYLIKSIKKDIEYRKILEG